MIRLVRSSVPLILMLLAAFALITGGWLASQWLRSVDYTKNQFRIINSDQFNEQDLEGYVVYLDFWASWCAPCRQSFPWLQRMHDRFADTNLRIVAVNLDQATSPMEEFLAEYNVEFTIVADPSYRLFRKYAIEGIPTSLLLNESGEEIWRHPGFRLEHATVYESKMKNALGI